MSDDAPVRFGAVEAGGTKFVCLIGSSPDDIVARTRIPTRDPQQTLAEVVSFFKEAAGPPPVAAFGAALTVFSQAEAIAFVMRTFSSVATAVPTPRPRARS